jgi:CRP/FNR family transcriptional regulator, cyclic AMP receptor protein
MTPVIRWRTRTRCFTVERMTRAEEKFAVDHLGSIPLFDGVSPKDLAKIGRLCDQVRVVAGTELVTQGSLGYECYIILSGSADVIVDNEVVATLANGDYFGELSVIDHLPRSATVRTSTDMDLVVFGPRQFASALGEVKTLNFNLLQGMAARLRAANDLIVA